MNLRFDPLICTAGASCTVYAVYCGAAGAADCEGCAERHCPRASPRQHEREGAAP